MTRTLLAAAVVVTALSGCANPELDAKIATLEGRIEKLEQAPKAPAGAPGAAAPVDDAKEQAAMELLRSLNEDVEKLAYPAAKEKLAKLDAEYNGTRAQRSAARIKDEIDVIGREVTALKVSQWYQGNTNIDDGKATLLVFWEVWCPHCKREVPKLEETYQKYHSRGLNMVGLTKQTRNVSDDDVRGFLKENEVTYPIAKEDGDAVSELYAVRGIPAAAVVKNGKVVWRGHPARINDAMIEDWIGG